jgi:hypothetical protein
MSAAAIRPAFRMRPISTRFPEPDLLLEKGSDRRLGSATPPEACCSSKSLGTFFNMRRRAFCVNSFLAAFNTFQQIPSPVRSIGYKGASVDSL